MATSGSTDWTLNRNQVITGALRKLAVLSSGGTPTSAQITDAAETVNALVKILQAKGMPLWRITSKDFTTTSGTSSYTIGVSQTVNAPKPIRVHQAFRTMSSGVNTPLMVENRYDFMNLPVSTSITGTPVTLYYQPLRTTGTIKLWPIPDDSTTTITMHYQTPFEDMDGAFDDFDFPSEWILPLIYLTAWTLCPEYGIPTMDRLQLEKEAKYWQDEALSGMTEEGSIFFQPDRGW